MRRPYRILLPLAAMFVSCEKELVIPPDAPLYRSGDTPILVEPLVLEDWQRTQTKAASDIPDITSGEDLHSGGFGVYAYYTGAADFSGISWAARPFGVVLYDREFEWSGTAWQHASGTPAEFWPMTTGEKLTFFAYAPYDVWHSSVQTDTVRFRVPFIEIDTGNCIASDMSAGQLEAQKDILWGTNSSGLAHKNVSKSDAHYSSGTVDMQFRHALSKVRFSVAGSLASENVVFTRTGGSETKKGETVTENGEETITDEPTVTSGVTRGSTETASSSNYDTYYGGSYYFQDASGTRYKYRRPYTATRTFTQTKTYKVTETEVYLERENGGIERQGKRYMIESVSLKGFNRKGTLLLDNDVAYEPSWRETEAFTGDGPEYVIDGGNVLSTSLRCATTAEIEASPGVYMGVQSNPSDLMGGYFLYAIPRTASSGDRISVTLTYRGLEIEGSSTGSRTREVVKKRSKDVSCTRSYSITRTVYLYKNSKNDWTSETSFSISNFGFPDSHEFTDETWGAETGTFSTWMNYSESAWELDTEESSPSYTVTYKGDPVTLEGAIVSSFIGGYEYNVRLILAGDTMEILVAPNPWEVKDTDFDYDANENEPIQRLDYDSSTIDYVDGGDVYINNRVARFSFLLGAGRYNAWQARFVGSPGAFGFTDENGEFITTTTVDPETLAERTDTATTIRGNIDPSQLNNLYIKARRIPASVTSRSTLRIYYLDPSGKATVALNLVQDYNEWTIVQNAN